MLHSLRKRLQDFAEREAVGESFWTPDFSERARTRLTYVLQPLLGGTGDTRATYAVFTEARRLIGSQEGMYSLTGKTDPREDFFAYYQGCADDDFPTVVEALCRALDAYDNAQDWMYRKGLAAKFSEGANEIFTQERISWELIEGQMVEIRSKELHSEVVEPTLHLIHEARFAKVDKQYRDALAQLADDKAANAITDAGTALQEMLEELGCEGNQLGDLIRSARKKQLLGAHDSPMLDAIEKTMHWIAADRSEMGDAHHATQATRDDAWLIVHVVGAVMVRLASGKQRTK